MTETPLVKIRGLVKEYALARRRRVQAIREVDLDIAAGQIVGLIGESGCGKTTLGRCSLGLVKPTAGQVIFDGTEITTLSERKLRPFRRQMQIIFQDPYLSLDPRMSVGAAVEEPLVVHQLGGTRRRRQEIVADLLEQVGLPRGAIDRFPHEFSGGQRQRIGIARALAVDPRFVVADEPVSALDVSIQAQILQLLLQLQRERNLSYLLISHDLRVVQAICHRVSVMYLGRIVEEGSATMVNEALHPYTRALAAAVPTGERMKEPLEGEVPTAATPPSGCAFHPRCPVFRRRQSPACMNQVPLLRETCHGHRVACHEAA